MVRLHANAEYAALTHGIAAARDVANPRRGQHKIFVTHDLCCRRRDFRDDGLLHSVQLLFGGSVVEQKFAKLAHRHAR